MNISQTKRKARVNINQFILNRLQQLPVSWVHWEQSEGTFNVSLWLAGPNLTALLDESMNAPLKWTDRSSQD